MAQPPLPSLLEYLVRPAGKTRGKSMAQPPLLSLSLSLLRLLAHNPDQIVHTLN